MKLLLTIWVVIFIGIIFFIIFCLVYAAITTHYYRKKKEEPSRRGTQELIYHKNLKQKHTFTEICNN